MEELQTVVREESKREVEPSETQIYTLVLKVRGQKGHNRLVLAVSIRETFGKCQASVTLHPWESVRIM